MTYIYPGKYLGKRYIPKLTLNNSILHCLKIIMSDKEFISNDERKPFTLPEYAYDPEHSFEFSLFDAWHYRTKDVFIIRHRHYRGFIVDEVEAYLENNKLDFIYIGHEWGYTARHPWTMASAKMNWKWIEAQLKLICINLI